MILIGALKCTYLTFYYKLEHLKTIENNIIF